MSRLIYILLYPIFYIRLKYLRKKDLVTVLCFHNINDKNDTFYPGLNTDIFDSICKFFSRHFTSVNFNNIEKHKTSKRPLLIFTFDDAYSDFYENAFPILEKYNLTSVLNVITACPDENRTYTWQAFINYFKRIGDDKCISFGHKLNFYSKDFHPEQFALAFTNYFQKLDQNSIEELAKKHLYEVDYKASKMMSWDQIRTVYSKGHEIGAHTHNHYYINSLNKKQVQFELSHSKQRIEKELNCNVQTFAFPGAKYDLENIKVANELGLENCLLMENQPNEFGNKRIHRYLSYGNSSLRLLIQSLGIESLLRR
jgi:peptidoglycan/xylan/chitin deacetylase (PgdA/CDA1 family)